MTLKEYLLKNNLSQTQFGKLVGLSKASINAFILGRRRPGRYAMGQIKKHTNGKLTEADFK